MLHELEGGGVGVLDGGGFPLALRLLLAQRLPQQPDSEGEARNIHYLEHQRFEKNPIKTR